MLRIQTVFTGIVGSPYLSTMFFESTGLAEMVDAQSAVRGFWEDLAGLMQSATTIQVQSDVDVIDPVTGHITATGSAPVAVLQAGGNAPLPQATQGLVRWRSGVFVNGKEIRGRTFLPSMANDAQLGGKPSSALKVTADAAAAALLAAPVNLVVWSRKNGMSAPVTSGSTWSEFAVLRSRRD